MAPKKKNQTDDFRERAERDQPAAWMPEAGDTLVGTLEGYTTGRSKHPDLPDSYPIALVRDEDTGEVVSVHIVLTAIRGQFENADPKVGERIAVSYRGKVESKETGRSYHNYRVTVDRPDAGETAKSFADMAAATPDPVTEPDAES